jgi:hypothetical protein
VWHDGGTTLAGSEGGEGGGMEVGFVVDWNMKIKARKWQIANRRLMVGSTSYIKR